MPKLRSKKIFMEFWVVFCLETRAPINCISSKRYDRINIGVSCVKALLWKI